MVVVEEGGEDGASVGGGGERVTVPHKEGADLAAGARDLLRGGGVGLIPTRYTGLW